MKPYKLIQSNKPLKKRTLVIPSLRQPKIPLIFFSESHAPKKQNIKFVFEKD